MSLKSKSAYIGMLAVGAGAFVVAQPDPAWAEFDSSVIDWAIQELCGHITGHLGGLLTAVAATGALVAAAMGTYRVFYGAIITAVGAFAVSTIMSLHFGDAAQICDGGAAAGQGGNGGGDAPPDPAGGGDTGDAPPDPIADR